MIRGKRKRLQDEVGDSLDDFSSLTIDKKPRKPSTPGQIRLFHDVQDFGFDGVLIRPSPSPSVIYLDIYDSHILERNKPYVFEVEAPRFYPHDPPIVHLISGPLLSPFLSSKGRVVHPTLR